MKTSAIIQEYLNSLNINSLETLDDVNHLIQSHLSTYAFSSVKVLLKDEISLDLEAIFDSIVVKRRGGYCFEQNKLIYEALKLHGFDVQFYLARVVNNLEGDEPQTHRFTILTYEGQRYIIDVGIGFRSPTCAIPFKEEVTTTQGVQYWVQEFDNNMYGLMSLESNQPFRITKFDLKYCNEGDFEMGHFYSHQHPCAVFVNNLVLSTITQDEIRSLRNNSYLKIRPTEVKQVSIKDADHLFTIMKDDFKTNFSKEEVKTIYKKYVIGI